LIDHGEKHISNNVEYYLYIGTRVYTIL